MPSYVQQDTFHACDTCGAPCCGRGWYPMPGDEGYDADTAAAERDAFEHHFCDHTNRPCPCGGTVAPSGRVGNPDGDLDAGWYF